MLRGLRRHRPGFAQALAAFALLTMVVRALVPAGYMFAPAQDGRFITVTLCSGHGVAEAIIDLSTGQVIDAGDAPTNNPVENAPGADAPCVFATVAALAAPAQALALPLAFSVAAVDHPHSVVVAPGRGLAAPPPWSTGPPYTL